MSTNSKVLLDKIKKIPVLPSTSEIESFLKYNPSTNQIQELNNFLNNTYNKIKTNPISSNTVINSKRRLDKIKKLINPKLPIVPPVSAAAKKKEDNNVLNASSSSSSTASLANNTQLQQQQQPESLKQQKTVKVPDGLNEIVGKKALQLKNSTTVSGPPTGPPTGPPIGPPIGPPTGPKSSLSPPPATGAEVTVTYQGKTSEFTVTPSSTSSGGKRKSHKKRHHKKRHTKNRHMRKMSHKRRH